MDIVNMFILDKLQPQSFFFLHFFFGLFCRVGLDGATSKLCSRVIHSEPKSDSIVCILRCLEITIMQLSVYCELDHRGFGSSIKNQP